MRRGSFRLRLPRGRRSLKASPAFLGVAIFLVILVPTLFYLFPHAPDSRSLDSDLSDSQTRLPSGSDDHADDLVAKAKSDNAPEPVLKVASSGASLVASVNSSPNISQVYLENTGTLKLRQVKVQSDGKTLGLLSELVPGEKKVLAISGPLNGIQVSAFDPSEKQIVGQVQRNSTVVIEAASATAGATVLNTMAAPEVPVPFSGSTEVSAPAPAASAKPRHQRQSFLQSQRRPSYPLFQSALPRTDRKA